MEDILRTAPKCPSESVCFELGVEYYAHLAWHLKERSTEEFGWTANVKGIQEGIDSAIRREVVNENDWKREPVIEQVRRQAGKKVRKNPRQAVRRPEKKSYRTPKAAQVETKLNNAKTRTVHNGLSYIVARAISTCLFA